MTEFVIVDDSILEHRVGEAVFFYREAMPRDLDHLYSKHTRGTGKKARLDLAMWKEDLIRMYCTGWSNVTVGGVACDFDPDMLRKMRYGTRYVADDLVGKITGTWEADEAEAEPGNPMRP